MIFSPVVRPLTTVPADPDAAQNVVADPVRWGILLLLVLLLLGIIAIFGALFAISLRRGKTARAMRPVPRPPTPDPWKEAGERVDPIDDDAEFEEDEDDDEDDVWEDEPEGPEDDDDGDGEIDARRPPRGTPPPAAAS